MTTFKESGRRRWKSRSLPKYQIATYLSPEELDALRKYVEAEDISVADALRRGLNKLLSR